MMFMSESVGDRYRIIRPLGEGGMGETFLAEDTQMPSGRQCVIKRLKSQTDNPSAQEEVRKRFKKEAATLENLGHDSHQIPDLYAYFEQDGDYYLVQEFIQGKTLQQKIEAEGPLSEAETQGILTALLPVLQTVHGKKIIHRDIKPENIILREPDQKPVLIDFGAVRETMSTVVNSQGVSSRSIVIGTPGFMAPEQSGGRAVFGSDLYSLGLTTIYMLTGKIPQELDTDPGTGELIWQRALPNISPGFADFINRAVQSHSRDRFPSAGAMLSALNSGAVPCQGKPTAPPTVIETPVSSDRNSNSIPTMVNTSAVAPTGGMPTEFSNQQSSNRDNWLIAIVMALLIGGSILGAAFVLRPQTESTVQGPAPDPSPSPSVPSEPQNTGVVPPQPQQPYSPVPPVTPVPNPVVSTTPSPSPTPSIAPDPVDITQLQPQNFPKAECGDTNPAGLQEFYQVFTRKTDDRTLTHIQNRFCKDAYLRTEQGVIQIASFRSEQKARAFSQFVAQDAMVGSTGIGSAVKR